MLWRKMKRNNAIAMRKFLHGISPEGSQCIRTNEIYLINANVIFVYNATENGTDKMECIADAVEEKNDEIFY